MSEWFYLQRWYANSKKVWTVVDENFNICTPDDQFYDKYEAHRIAEELSSKGEKYLVVHNESETYFTATKDKEEKNEYHRNE